MHPSSLILFVLAGSCVMTHGFNMRELVQNLVIAAEGTVKHPGVYSVKSLEGHAFFNYLNKEFGGKSEASLFKTFIWSDCGPSDELANVTKIDVSPDPVHLPGTLNVSFSANLKETLDAPLKVQIKLEKHFVFGWVTIPCIEDIGSCSYDDICEKLKEVDCPAEVVAQGLTCQCPFTQGNYNFPGASYSIDQGVPDGKYRATVKVSMYNKPVSCINIDVDVE